MSTRKRRTSNASRRRFSLLIGLISVLIGAALCFTAIMVVQSLNAPVAPSVVEPVVDSTPPPEPTVTTLRIAACGDNLIHEGLYMQAATRAGGNGYDFAALYENVAPFFADYDINWINQETLLTDDFTPSGYPMFCSPTAVGRALYDIGFRVFATSNNHSYDKFASGIASTLAFWDSMPEDTVSCGYYAGAEDYGNIALQTVQDVTIAYLPYTEHTNGLPTPADAPANVIYTSELDVIEQQIKLAREQADVVIACVHWGTENSHVVNDAQRALAQNMADWGADMIIGTHPHVVQAVENVVSQDGRQVPVYYSLGNFVSLQNQTDNLIGIVGTFDIVKTTQPDGTSACEITQVKAHPVVMHYDSGWQNARVYWAKDYTSEMAARHGNGAMSTEYIRQVLQENISADVLVLD